jgi:hypothetical protein
MYSPIELLALYNPAEWQYASSPEAVSNMLSVMEEMVSHNLEASRIVNSESGLSIVWEDGFNVGHRAEIICCNDGSVIGKTINEEKVKMWRVSGFKNELVFSLSLAETLEYVRHFIWANHNV